MTGSTAAENADTHTDKHLIRPFGQLSSWHYTMCNAEQDSKHTAQCDHGVILSTRNIMPLSSIQAGLQLVLQPSCYYYAVMRVAWGGGCEDSCSSLGGLLHPTANSLHQSSQTDQHANLPLNILQAMLHGMMLCVMPDQKQTAPRPPFNH